MPRPSLSVVLAFSVVATGCKAIADIANAPHITTVAINAPAGLLVGDTATAVAIAVADDGRERPGWPRKWSSSNPSMLSIDGNGLMRALSGGGAVTITGEVDNKTGTATVDVSSDDNRFGYAFADQPTATSPYAPPAGTSFNSSGGTVRVRQSAQDGARPVPRGFRGTRPARGGERDCPGVALLNGK